MKGEKQKSDSTMEKPDEHALAQATRAHSSSDLPQGEQAALAGVMYTVPHLYGLPPKTLTPVPPLEKH